MTTTSWRPPAPRRPSAGDPTARGRTVPPGTRRVAPPAVRRLRRLARRCRRPTAALLLAAAVGLVAYAVLSGAGADASGSGSGVPVVVAVRDLPAGSDLSEGTETSRLPADAVPEGALDPDDVAVWSAPATLAAPVRRGEVLTDVRLTGPGLVASLVPGQVALPVAVASPLPEGLVAPGSSVTVLDGGLDGDLGGGSTGRVLVDSATVLVVSTDATTTGLLGSGSGSAVVVLALAEADAARVASAASTSGVVLAVAGA